MEDREAYVRLTHYCLLRCGYKEQFLADSPPPPPPAPGHLYSNKSEILPTEHDNITQFVERHLELNSEYPFPVEISWRNRRKNDIQQNYMVNFRFCLAIDGAESLY